MLTTIFAILVAIFIFSVIVLVHECGHFFTALRFGVKVEEFGIGIPPRAKVLKKKNGIIYSLNWIPFGGFVRMYGEDDPGISKKDKKAFSSKKIWQKMVIVLAGVFMNFVLAWGLLTVGYSVGMHPILLPTEYEQAVDDGLLTRSLVVTQVTENSLAEEAGLQSEDVIFSVNGELVTEANALRDLLEQNKNAEITYGVLRGEEELEVAVQLDEEGKSGLMVAEGYESHEIQYPIYQAPVVAAQDTVRLSWATVRFTVSFFEDLVMKRELQDNVGGPVKIGQMTYELVQMGSIIDLIRFAALISLSIGVINLMPLPALDGGRFLFLSIEAVIGRPVNSNFEALVHAFGFLLLLLLLVVITYRDVFSLFV